MLSWMQLNEPNKVDFDHISTERFIGRKKILTISAAKEKTASNIIIDSDQNVKHQFLYPYLTRKITSDLPIMHSRGDWLPL